MFRCKAVGPYIIQKIYEDESVTVKDPRNSKVFTIKSKKLKVFPINDKSIEMESLMLVEPYDL